MGKTSSSFLLILVLCVASSVLCKGGAPEIRQSDNGSARREPSSTLPASVFSSAVDVGGGLEVYHTDYHGPIGHSPPHPQHPFSASSPAGWKHKSFKNSKGR